MHVLRGCRARCVHARMRLGARTHTPRAARCAGSAGPRQPPVPGQKPPLTPPPPYPPTPIHTRLPPLRVLRLVKRRRLCGCSDWSNGVALRVLRLVKRPPLCSAQTGQTASSLLCSDWSNGLLSSVLRLAKRPPLCGAPPPPLAPPLRVPPSTPPPCRLLADVRAWARLCCADV